MIVVSLSVDMRTQDETPSISPLWRIATPFFDIAYFFLILLYYCIFCFVWYYPVSPSFFCFIFISPFSVHYQFFLIIPSFFAAQSTSPSYAHYSYAAPCPDRYRRQTRTEYLNRYCDCRIGSYRLWYCLRTRQNTNNTGDCTFPAYTVRYIDRQIYLLCI